MLSIANKNSAEVALPKRPALKRAYSTSSLPSPSVIAPDHIGAHNPAEAIEYAKPMPRAQSERRIAHDANFIHELASLHARFDRIELSQQRLGDAVRNLAHSQTESTTLSEVVSSMILDHDAEQAIMQRELQHLRAQVKTLTAPKSARPSRAASTIAEPTPSQPDQRHFS